MLSIYYISGKDRKTLLLIVTAPIFWYMAPFINPIQIASLFFLWGYYFISKYDKKEKISSAGLTYLFCRELAHTIHGLAKLAVIGMIGDMMEKNLDKINNKILEESEAIKKRGLLIYPATRPLNRTLEFSSNPYIPGVTGDSYGVTKLLRDAGLTHKEGKYPSLIELNPDEMSNLITSIMLRHPKITNNTDIIGDIFLVKFFNKLEDARELSAMINACSRLGESQVALQFCLEIPSAKKRAEVLYAKYKRLIISGLDLVSKIQKVEGGGFVIINTKSGVKDTIVGTIASILSNSKVYEPGTIIVTMAYSGNKIKVSARSVSRQGRNVRNVLHGVVSKIGGEVGGHEFAAGCLINKDKEEEFIKNLKENLEIELVKI